VYLKFLYQHSAENDLDQKHADSQCCRGCSRLGDWLGPGFCQASLDKHFTEQDDPVLLNEQDLVVCQIPRKDVP